MADRDAYIVDYVRTPIGRYGKAMAFVRPDDMVAGVLGALTERKEGLATAVDEVVVGCANQAGEDNRNIARMALLLASYPTSVPGVTVNRLCASGMDAVLVASRMIRAGEADVVVAGGVESMSRAPYAMAKADRGFLRDMKLEDTTIGWRFVNEKMKTIFGIDSMPETAENVAEEYDISRADQDAFALRSQRRAAAAADWRGEEILPIMLARRGDAMLALQVDEHTRYETTLEALAELPTPFREGGTVTAGNSSGINDGAAGMIIASGAALAKHGWTAMARILAGAAAGVDPRIMGMGPVPATKKLCAQLGLSVQDFKAIELNEAFAAQALAVLRELGLPDDAEHVNFNGGAISLGHPLGMTGARLVGTLARELQRRGGGKGLATMCVGVGQGVAVALEAD